MASNHTNKFGLNQWSLSDNVIMEDFNEDNRKIDAALAAGTKIQCGTYTGNGEYGPEHPTALTFDFEPKFLLVRSSTLSMWDLSAGNLLLWVKGVDKDTVENHGTARHFMLTGNTLSWYVEGTYATAKWQMNSGTYYYVAIG